MTGRVAGVLVLVTVLLAACGHYSGLVARGRIAPEGIHLHVNWADCFDGFDCGYLHVPLDYSHPNGREIALALIRKRATNPNGRIGSLLFNPGGPGGSGVDFLRGAGGYLKDLNERFDLVSWDPRGVGASGSITCANDSEMDAFTAVDPVLDDADEKQAYIQALESFAAGCVRKSNFLLPFVDTASSARDMDLIRQALGDERLTYLGFSYGTYLGQWYAHLFPKHVRALALDGVLDASEPLGELRFLEAAAFQENLDAFFTACRDEPSCVYTRKGDPEQRLEASMEAIDRSPMRIGSRELTRGQAMLAVESMLYSPSDWTFLDEALAALDSGDARLFLQLADSAEGRNGDGTYSSNAKGYGAAVECLDWGASSDIASYDGRGALMAYASTLFGPFFQYADVGCMYWPVKGRHVNEDLTAAGAPPILVVAATGDPATPYPEAEAVASRTPGAVLLTRDGWGHGSYFASQCVQDAENAYLISLTLSSMRQVCTS